MTQDKELLLKDLCARIPYGIKGIIEDGDVVTTPLRWYAEQSLELSIRYMVVKNGWRPYLFPLSSMTEEQKKIYDKLPYHSTEWQFVDWLNANHFDYRGLIKKGLAIDATELNIY